MIYGQVAHAPRTVPFAQPSTYLWRPVLKENFMTTYASGTSEVELPPQDDKSVDATLAIQPPLNA